ncbi:MAG: hypothetical protein JXR89_13065, partial [Deltaproteobacteria bacterium]|nr:hypothetical protein [Deltaproteobacteria bacterium]
MQTYLDCLACFMSQIVRVGQLLELPERDCLNMLCEFSADLAGIELSDPPPKASIRLYRMISRYAGRSDPFAEIKR